MSEQKRPEICEYCALGDHDAYICARWRLSYAVNELKKAIPLVRRTAAENMKFTLTKTIKREKRR